MKNITWNPILSYLCSFLCLSLSELSPFSLQLLHLKLFKTLIVLKAVKILASAFQASFSSCISNQQCCNRWDVIIASWDLCCMKKALWREFEVSFFRPSRKKVIYSRNFMGNNLFLCKYRSGNWIATNELPGIVVGPLYDSSNPDVYMFAMT